MINNNKIKIMNNNLIKTIKNYKISTHKTKYFIMINYKIKKLIKN